LLHLCEGPADGFTDFAEDAGLARLGRRGRLGIFEPGEGFGGGGFLTGWGACGGVGLYERVHREEYHRLWCLSMATTYCGLLFDNCRVGDHP
jgi:hypothetical protein